MKTLDCNPDAMAALSPAQCSANEALAERIAHIIGESSAAANALKELKRQRESGRTAWLTQHGRVWCVHSRSPNEKGQPPCE